MDLYYRNRPYKSGLSIREVSYELGIPKTTLSRYLKKDPNYKSSYFEQDGEVINQYYWGKLIKSYSDIDTMAKELKITVNTCTKRFKKKELWFHKYFSISI